MDEVEKQWRLGEMDAIRNAWPKDLTEERPDDPKTGKPRKPRKVNAPSLRLLVFATIGELDELGQCVLDTNEEKMLVEIIKEIRARQIKENFMGPADRKVQTAKNLKSVLDWLRLEPYCDVDIMSLVLNVSEDSARETLNQFVKLGWLVRDEIAWVGMSRPKHLWGVSSKGLLHLRDAAGVQPDPRRYFKRGRTNPRTGQHVLGIQLTRIYYQKLDNPKNKLRRYRAARDLPNYGSKHYKWQTYPDFVVDGVPVDREIGDGTASTNAIAIEVELIYKSNRRYDDLIDRHKSNIDDENYDLVIYYLPDKAQADNLKELFAILIKAKTKTGSESDFDKLMSRFQFKSLEGLGTLILRQQLWDDRS